MAPGRYLAPASDVDESRIDSTRGFLQQLCSCPYYAQQTTRPVTTRMILAEEVSQDAS
jgi:hypothetical protein